MGGRRGSQYLKQCLRGQKPVLQHSRGLRWKELELGFQRHVSRGLVVPYAAPGWNAFCSTHTLSTECREQRAECREQSAESRVECGEQSAGSREQRAESREQSKGHAVRALWTLLSAPSQHRGSLS
jgi:hypothetical protein